MKGEEEPSASVQLLRLGTDGSAMLSPERGRCKVTTQDRLTRYYAGALAMTAAMLAARARGRWGGSWERMGSALLCVTTAVAERWIVPLSKTTQLSVVSPSDRLCCRRAGPLPAGIVAAASMLGDPIIARREEHERRPLLRWLSLTCISFIIGVTAGLVAQLVDEIIAGGTGTMIAVTFVAMAVAEGAGSGFAMLTAAIRGARSVRATALSGPSR